MTPIQMAFRVNNLGRRRSGVEPPTGTIHPR